MGMAVRRSTFSTPITPSQVRVRLSVPFLPRLHLPFSDSPCSGHSLLPPGSPCAGQRPQDGPSSPVMETGFSSSVPWAGTEGHEKRLGHPFLLQPKTPSSPPSCPPPPFPSSVIPPLLSGPPSHPHSLRLPLKSIVSLGHSHATLGLSQMLCGPSRICLFPLDHCKDFSHRFLCARWSLWMSGP